MVAAVMTSHRQSCRPLSGDKRFVLAIRPHPGIVNPPVNPPKRAFWVAGEATARNTGKAAHHAWWVTGCNG
jgi:hypothetical protein